MGLGEWLKRGLRGHRVSRAGRDAGGKESTAAEVGLALYEWWADEYATRLPEALRRETWVKAEELNRVLIEAAGLVWATQDYSVFKVLGNSQERQDILDCRDEGLRRFARAAPEAGEKLIAILNERARAYGRAFADEPKEGEDGGEWLRGLGTLFAKRVGREHEFWVLWWATTEFHATHMVTMELVHGLRTAGGS